ncbi:unnamed protein product, partial [Rotaria sp. Silwood1]
MFADFDGLTYLSVYRETTTKTQMKRLTVSNVIHFEVRK